MIEFFCVECGQLVRTPAAAAGKKGKCPNCRAVIDIPKGRGPAAAGRKSEVRSHESGFEDEKPRRKRYGPAPSATPFDDDETDELPDLTPIEGLEPYEPRRDALPELTPLFDEVLPPLAAPPVSAIATPPSGVPFAAGARPRLILSDYGRSGLPWERDPSIDTFIETVRWVLISPGDAFDTMRRTAGFGSPFGFLIVSTVLINFLAVIIGFVMGLVRVVLFWAFMDTKQPLHIPWDRVFLHFGGAACLAVTAAVFRGSIGGFITAAVYHLALLICGAARGGFQTTYRVIAFGSGSIYVLFVLPAIVFGVADMPIEPIVKYILLAVPLCALLFALAMHFIVLTYGFRNAHATSGWQAFGAVCLAIMIYVLLVVAIGIAAFIYAQTHGIRPPLRSLGS